jgi:hypothetical protein
MAPVSPNPFGEEPRRGHRRLRRRASAPPDGDLEELRLLVTAANEVEAEMIAARLVDAGIPATQEKSNQAAALYGAGMVGSRHVYVRGGDLARAAELLAAAGPTDDELAELSRRSFEEITGHPPPAD